MAVAFDAKSTEFFVGFDTEVLDSSLTVGAGSNRALVVAVLFSAADPGTTSVIWDVFGTAQNMTLLDQFDSSSFTGTFGSAPISLRLYGLVAPTSGNNILAIDTVNNCQIDGIAVSFTGVLQTGGTDTFANAGHATGTSASASVTIASATGDMLVGQYIINAFSNISAYNGTELYSSFFNVSANGANRAPGAASVAMTATLGSSTLWGAQAVNIVAVAGGGGTPFSQDDWPVPRGQVVRRQDWQKSFPLPLQQTLPPRQTDWPVPKKWSYRAVGHTDSFKLPLQQVMPPRQTEWPLPTRAKPPLVQDEFQIGLGLFTTVPIVVNPGFASWFNPWGPQRPVADYQWSFTATGTLPPPAFPTVYQFDWPNPTRAKPPVVVDWQQSSTWIASQPPPTLPASRQLDWPNPPRGRPPLVLDWINLARFLSPPPSLAQVDWPNPQQPRYLVRDWMWRSWAPLTPPAPLTTSRQPDWPLPMRRKPPVVRDWVMGSTWVMTQPLPVIPMSRLRDWPVPRGAKPNQSLGRINNSIGFILTPPQAPRETLANRSGRVRWLKNEVGRVRWVSKMW
jgi:hypothetical protein